MYRPSRSSSVSRDYSLYSPSTSSSISSSRNPIPYTRTNSITNSPISTSSSSSSADLITRYSRATSLDPVGKSGRDSTTTTASSYESRYGTRNGSSTNSNTMTRSYNYSTSSRDDEDRSLATSKKYGSASAISSTSVGSTFSRYKVSQPSGISHSSSSTSNGNYYRGRGEITTTSSSRTAPSRDSSLSRGNNYSHISSNSDITSLYSSASKYRNQFDLTNDIKRNSDKAEQKEKREKELDEIEIRFQRLYEKYVKNDESLGTKIDENSKSTSTTPRRSPIELTPAGNIKEKSQEPALCSTLENNKSEPNSNSSTPRRSPPIGEVSSVPQSFAETSISSGIKNSREANEKVEFLYATRNPLKTLMKFEMKTSEHGNELKPRTSRSSSRTKSRSRSKSGEKSEQPKISNATQQNGDDDRNLPASVARLKTSEVRPNGILITSVDNKHEKTADSKFEKKLELKNDNLMSDDEGVGASNGKSEGEISKEKAKSKSPTDTLQGKRKRRDPDRNLEKLRESLAPLLKEKRQQQQQETQQSQVPQTCIPPLLMITQPSEPSTPTAEATFFDVPNGDAYAEETFRDAVELEDEDFEDEEDSDAEWTEAEDEEDYESDFEYSVDTTFQLNGAVSNEKTSTKTADPLKSISACVSRCSPMVSDYDSDNSVPFPLPTAPEDARGRVNRLFAIPPPTFSCSVSYDGQGWNSSSEEGTVLSCQDEQEELDDFYDYKVLPVPKEGYSSSLGVYESAEENEEYNGEQVGCTLRLVDKLAMKESDSDDEEYYDYEDEEYTDEELSEYEDEEEIFESDEDLESERSDRSEEMRSIVDDRSLTVDIIPPSMASSLIEVIECIEVDELLVSMDDNEEKAEETQIEGIEGQKEIHFVPTYVKPVKENLTEESANRFAVSKPSTDFARKSVIQPPKLERAKVTTVDVRFGESPKKEAQQQDLPTVVVTPAEKVDKSGVRKSILNMKEDEAQKKREQNEKEAREKARQYGTVNAISGMFTPKKEEPIVYKKSSRLVQNYEVPKRKYEIVKPQINDDFDKQLEELRAQMKAGSSALQSQLKELSKDVIKSAEDAKQKDKAARHQITVQQASGAFEQAGLERAKWKALRDAEVEKELARIEADRPIKKKKPVEKPSDTGANEVKPEPKRTVRRIVKKDQPSAGEIKSLLRIGGETIVLENKPPNSSLPPSTNIPSVGVNPDQKNDSIVEKRILRRYSGRRKTQEILNESLPTKLKTDKKKKRKSRKRKFTSKTKDVDEVLGWTNKRNLTFEEMENVLFQKSLDLMKTENLPKRKRREKENIWISDLTDIDKLYKSSEIRDIICSIHDNY